ncbi:hypothetical protein K431DRAFT_93804 [Polychaeton citri CBS 116435]|uniref:Uncharacterized protein n=1 Tax=Polychaeton citri CBS 116435 TaxID=1314669 RepID=A0A9P4Q992_9PEZI|nr:hypothetical protein K431DRAFT_93804 [Polychaeton citri CBS 116435]
MTLTAGHVDELDFPLACGGQRWWIPSRRGKWVWSGVARAHYTASTWVMASTRDCRLTLSRSLTMLVCIPSLLTLTFGGIPFTLCLAPMAWFLLMSDKASWICLHLLHILTTTQRYSVLCSQNP